RMINLLKEMHDLSMQPDPDSKAVFSKQDEINKLHDEMATEKISLLLKIRAVLSADQKQKLVALIRQGPVGGPGGMAGAPGGPGGGPGGPGRGGPGGYGGPGGPGYGGPGGPGGPGNGSLFGGPGGGQNPGGGQGSLFQN